MLRSWIICSVVCCGCIMVIGSGDIGPGKWNVLYIQKCDEEYHKFKFDINQRKIDRTHDGFNADFTLDDDLSDDYGVRVDICKHVDGGCKQYQVLSDDRFVNFANKYASNNVRACLEIIGVDPPEFPVKKGNYNISNYVFDYDELPDDGIYGVYIAKAFLLEKKDEVGCVEVHVEFSKHECEEDEDCEEE